MDILNFISWIRGGRKVSTVDPTKTLIPLGVKDSKRDDSYLAATITVQDLADQIVPPPTPINPTDTYIPYNDGGVLEDSTLRQDAPTRRIYNSYDFQISRQGFPSVLGLYQDADGGFGQVIPDQGIQWGYENANPVFGPQNWLDCSIINLPAPAGAFGSTLAIKTQKSLSFVPANVDTQQVALTARPWSFLTATGGISIYGGNATTNEDSYLNVIGDNSSPSFPKFSDSVAKFSGAMSGVVFPNVTAANQAMMLGEPGMVVFNVDTNKLQVFANGNWENLN